jgi:hypothetical protein
MNKSDLKVKVKNATQKTSQLEWLDKLWANRNGKGGNKMRTYRHLIASPVGAAYSRRYIPVHYKRLYSRFRHGTAPLAIETGRYSKVYIPPGNRICPLCGQSTEDEVHALIDCKYYEILRRDCYTIAKWYF